MNELDDMPKEIMPAALQQYAAQASEAAFQKQLETAEYDTLQATDASSHVAVMRALEKSSINPNLPIVDIIAKIRAANIQEASLMALCEDWENYRQKLFAANSAVLRQVSSSIEKGAYDRVLALITFNNCFTNSLWANKKIDLREDQFPTMNGDTIDQFNEVLERDSKLQRKQVAWSSEAPTLLAEIRKRCGVVLSARQKRTLAGRAQQFISLHWEPAFKAMTEMYTAKVQSVEQTAQFTCLPGLDPYDSLKGLIATFKQSWVGLFNSGQCTFAQVQQFIDTQTTEVRKLKEENERALRDTNYSKMQHDYTCAACVNEWLVAARDLAAGVETALERFFTAAPDCSRVILQLAKTGVLRDGDDLANNLLNNKRSVYAQLEHKMLAFTDRIGKAQSNLSRVNELTEVRKQAFQRAVLLDYATFVFHVIQLLVAHQTEYKDSLSAVDDGKKAAAGAGEVKADGKQASSNADRDRVFLDEYNRYIAQLQAILGLNAAAAAAGDGKEQRLRHDAAPDTTFIDTLSAQERYQNTTSMQALEVNRRDAVNMMRDIMLDVEAGNKWIVSVKQQLSQDPSCNAVLGFMDGGAQGYEGQTQVRGWTAWKVQGETDRQMADIAQRLFHYVDHVRRVFPSAFVGLQAELARLERATLDATTQAAADLGLSFKRVKLMSQPKETTAIGNMLSAASTAPRHTERKDEWKAPPVDTGMDLGALLATVSEWTEIAVICTLYKDSNTDLSLQSQQNLQMQTAHLSNPSGASRKRKLPFFE